MKQYIQILNKLIILTLYLPPVMTLKENPAVFAIWSHEKAVFCCECIFWFIFNVVYGREKLNRFCGQPASCLTQAHS